MSIQILDQDVINQISAGEVVERPAHLVKELLENSLDAGSTEITIEIFSGGRTIKISDNGCGIAKDDLVLALTRHATSKIQQTNDLWNLSTFGFRGEALASAAAVSKLTLSSREKSKDSSFQVISEFGKFSDIMPSSRNQGTEIKIENLFDNVPARLKFLKSDGSENAQIRNVVKALSLANANVEFKMIESGKLDLYFAKRTEFIERAKEVLNCKKLFSNSAQREDYKAVAYYSSPQDVAKTSKNIWIFAQNRWIQDRGLQAAVMEAYRNLLMHGEYPNVVIHLECKPGDIDVNIHPTKSQVKFQNPSLAFRAVQASVRDGLETAPWVPKNQFTNFNSVADNFENAVQSAVENYSANYQPPEPKNYAFQDQSLNKTQFQSKDFYFKNTAENHVVNPIQQASPKQSYWSSFQVVGQINLTYIVCQKDDQMILVDQHAAHERVAFEKLMRKWQGGSIDLQSYLFPLAIDLSPEKCEALLFYQKDIQKMGIEIEQMGPATIGIKSAPLFVKESSLPQVFEKLASDTLEFGGSFNLEKSISDLFATMACHSVIRAGQSLSLPEMKELLLSMDEFPLSSFCPHGRPVSVEMTFTEIEKMFGRIH
jgi:DNA mismatch repair protein MutL